MAAAIQILLKVFDVEAVTHPLIAAVGDYWCELNGGHPPPRKSFDFMKIYRIAPYLLMAERIAPETFKFICCGTAVAENFPRDLTGTVYSSNTVRVSRIARSSFFSDVPDTPALCYGRARMDWPNEEYADIVYGAFPLVSPAGTPSHVLACLTFAPRPPFEARLSQP